MSSRIERPEEGEDEDEEAIARRRAAIRERLKNLRMGMYVCMYLWSRRS